MSSSAPVRAVFVAAGSNIQPEDKLQLAARELRRSFPDISFSPAYRNSAVGFAGEDFINFVVGFTTKQNPREVLAELHRIEELCGRPRGAAKWEPRAMDLDILLFGDLTCDEPGLILPRPDLVKRPYMLRPMADLAPDLRHPTLAMTMAELWAKFDQRAHLMAPVHLTR